MTEQQRDRIAAAFERELASSPIPPDLRPQAVRRAKQSRNELAMPRQQWALALVAVLLAIAIVATLVGVRALHSSAPTPARSPLGYHHNGYLVMSDGNRLIAIDNAEKPLRHVILTLQTGVEVSDATYTRDGARLAYLNAGSSIWVLDTATGLNKQLTTCQCVKFSHLSWSPDGSRLAFTDGDRLGAAQLYVIDADGTHRTQLTHFSVVQSASQPSWSPDGTRIAFTTQKNIDVIRTDGSGYAVLLADASGPSDPAWSPDGSRIAYVLDPSSTPGTRASYEYQLWLMNPDGSHRTKIFVSPGCCVSAWGGPAWSPDATRIAVVALPSPAVQIGPVYTLWVMNADGSDPVSLGQVIGDRPAWQPVP